MNTSLLGPHAADDALVRLLDGASEPEEESGVRSHLGACEQCAARLATLRRRSAALSSRLAASAPEVPAFVPADPRLAIHPRARGRWGRVLAPAQTPWLRAAAVAVLLLGLGVLAPPLRAWVADWASEQWTRLATVLDPTEPAPPPPAPPPPASLTSVYVDPPTGVLALELAPHPAGGSLVLEPHAGAGVEIQVLRGGEVLVLPRAVRLQGHASAAAEYRVLLPADLRRVEVRRPDGAVARLDPRALSPGERRTIPLDALGPR